MSDESTAPATAPEATPAAPEAPAGPTIVQLKELIEREKQERRNKCAAEIRDVLAKYKCELDASVIVTKHGNISQVNVVIPKEEESKIV